MSCCGSKMIVNQEAVEENYDPTKPVCDNQNDFNQAVRHAIQFNMEEDRKNLSKNTVFVIVYMVFFIWAIMLALKVKGEDRVLHIALAVLFSPVYVLAYYLSGLYSSSEGGVFGMCRY